MIRSMPSMPSPVSSDVDPMTPANVDTRTARTGRTPMAPRESGSCEASRTQGRAASCRCPSCGRPIPDAAGDYERFLRRLFARQGEFERSLASAIQDDLGQQLAGALLYLEAFGRLPDHSMGEAKEAFQIGMGLLRDGVRKARRIGAQLQPLVGDGYGNSLGVEYLVHRMRNPDGPEIELVV